MKKIITVFAAVLAVSAFGFVSCSKENAKAKAVESTKSDLPEEVSAAVEATKALDELHNLSQDELNAAVDSALKSGELTAEQLQQLVDLEQAQDLAKQMKDMTEEEATAVFQKMVDNGASAEDIQNFAQFADEINGN
ncbi:MAG: hypothetical protein II547_01620 [Treponema sp.]|nr:hypothetical protein [Treponema sp.]MBQ5383851.1 hypothetical protein [Treponema sp.]